MKKVLFIFVLLISSCTTSLKEKLQGITSWGYQLQSYQKNGPIASLSKVDKRMWVIDPDFDGNRVEKKEIEKLNQNGSLAIAYLSIGEAEEYRDYFKNLNKNILLKENPHWKGNFKVKYWEPEWQKIIFAKIDGIVALGFKGVYLDIVDAFYEHSDKKLAADRMVSFIAAIKERALNKCDEFLVIQQNAPTLYQYTQKKNLLFTSVDALALEDAFFFGQKKHNNSWLPQDYVLKAARLYTLKGLKVFNVEYLTEKDSIQRYGDEIQNYPITPLVASRALDGSLIFAQQLSK